MPRLRSSPVGLYLVRLSDLELNLFYPFTRDDDRGLHAAYKDSAGCLLRIPYNHILSRALPISNDLVGDYH